MASSLTIANVEAGYGAVSVLHDVSLNVGAGETVALLGVSDDGTGGSRTSGKISSTRLMR